MRVRRIRETLDGLSYAVVDDDGQPIPVVSQFLRYLDARAARQKRSLSRPPTCFTSRAQKANCPHNRP
jgi:hypothetical protein